MSFVTPWMLGGAVLIGAPIVLHLIMRQKPRHLEFPALRFLKKRQEVNSRRLRLRHLLLLALRCAAIALLAIALARPTVRASGLMVDQEAPVAAAIVLDTSPRMNYRHQNQTRIEVARESSTKLLAQLPHGSEIAIVDASPLAPTFAVDLGAARHRLERLDATATARPLARVVQDALLLVSESELQRREVYVYTDLAASAWNDPTGALKRELEAHPDVALYLIDVGVAEPVNLSLGRVRLAAETISSSAPLAIEATVASVGREQQRTVAAYLFDETGTPRKRAQQLVTIPADAEALVEFQLSGLKPGTNQGYLTIEGEDSLPDDDRQYFTVDVRPSWEILVAASSPAEPQAQFLTQALAPESFRKSRFQCEVIDAGKLGETDLEHYAAIAVVDPAPLSEAAWERLEAYVRGGGGLAIWLGRHAFPAEQFNSPAALKLLPGPLRRRWTNQDEFLAPSQLTHPVLAKLRAVENVPWQSFPVFQYWRLSPLDPAANVVIPYNNGHPALLEMVVGRGRVLTTTTSISEAASDNDAWNVLLTGFGAWPYFTVVNEMMAYLVGGDRLNYVVSDTVVLHLDADQDQSVFSLTTPRGDQMQQTVDRPERSIAVTTTDVPGNYQLQAGGTSGVQRGFSVNLPTDATRLTRLPEDELTTLLGEERFRLSLGHEELERDIGLGRVGQELFPLLIILVAAVLAGEHILANRFYRQERPAAARASAVEGSAVTAAR